MRKFPAKPLECGLPHREPFVFVDEVLEIVPGISACGTKCFEADEPFFRGHFPGDPLVPGVILTEALAQVAGLVLQEPGLRLAAIRGMKFLRAVRPGEVIRLNAVRTGGAAGLTLFEVEASVGGEAAARGTVVLAGQGA